MYKRSCLWNPSAATVLKKAISIYLKPQGKYVFPNQIWHKHDKHDIGTINSLNRNVNTNILENNAKNTSVTNVKYYYTKFSSNKSLEERKVTLVPWRQIFVISWDQKICKSSSTSVTIWRAPHDTTCGFSLFHFSISISADEYLYLLYCIYCIYIIYVIYIIYNI